MSDYMLLLKASLNGQMAYRINFLGHFFLLLTLYSMKLLFIDSLFQFTIEVGNWTKLEMMFVLYVTLLITVVSDIFDVSIFQFYRYVSTGAILPYLVKPIGRYSILLCRWSRPSSLIIFGVLLLFFPLFNSVLPGADLLRWLSFGALFLFGVLSHLIFVSMLSLLTFVFHRYLPVDYIYSEMVRVCHYPFSIYSKGSIYGLILFIPMIFSASIPAAVLLGKKSYLPLYFVIICILLTIVHHCMFAVMLKKHDTLGG